ncbi:MAG: methyltransferase domain-containing protein [Polyangiaceae bacterium]|jgi:SAM-dependent methyltransferase
MRLPMDLLACPVCKGPMRDEIEALVCPACSGRYPISGEIPDLRVDGDARTEAVRAFYSRAPFPGYAPQENLGSLRARAAKSEFAMALDRAIAGDARIVELGCGTGQMCIFLATADRIVVGADLARASLELGASAARRSRVESLVFIETDLGHAALREAAFDVVYSSGVLHHTPDPRASFAAMARLARPGGIVVLGLYNAWARIPHRVRRGLGRLTGFRFIPFDPVLRSRSAEPARREAWLRDQYMHPEEHRHTLREVMRWFRENGVDYVRTYPDSRFGAETLDGQGLFEPAGDDWGFEGWVTQLTWAKTLAKEGGLWVTIGKKR